MMDRFRVCSPLVALAIASVCALSACDQGKPQEPTQVTTSAVLGSLLPGDIAVTCLNSATDEVQIVSLVAIAAGTDVKFTDNEWSGTGWVDLNETVDDVVPVPAAGMTPGKQLLFIPNGGGNIGNGPEQFFVYQGSIKADGGPFNFVWGTQISNPAGWGTTADGGTLANNISALPTDLANANIALLSSNPTFWSYTGPTSGTKAQLLADLKNGSNWTGPNAVDGGAPACPGDFTVIPDVVDSGAGSDSSTGAGGAAGSDAGAGGMVGTADSGAGGSTADGGSVDAPADSGAGGTAGTDGGAADTGAGGATADSGAGGATGADASIDAASTVDAKADAGSAVDAKADTGSTTDAKADAGSTADAKPDTGSTGGTDAKTSVDAGKDSGTTAKSSSGCGCSTASNSQNLSASVSLLALAGIVMTARRRRRR